MRTVDLTSDVELAARALADGYGLRGADAVHLATVAAVGEHRALFAVWDAAIRDGAAALGIAGLP